MPAQLKLISHKLCPYVQRAVIALTEKGVRFERLDIDLDNKPDWFLRISPLGKTPVLLVGDTAIFESAVILEYLEETQPNPLHPEDPLVRAEHRAWIEFNSAVLGDIWGLEIATDEAGFTAKTKQLEARLALLEKRLIGTPWFDGEKFSLVDAVFGPAFRYFDIIDEIGNFGIFANTPKIVQWRKNLQKRPSIRTAVSSDYPQALRDFLKRKGAYLSQLEARKAA
jgi:glutathione S-transferase